ncbi:MAG: DUF190 domain-containing protein [Phycisphaera sp.]|nr:DUF190 domain-containing protein [Phycisphaera sp.]
MGTQHPTPEDGCMMRVYIGENDRHGGLPLYEAIVREARKFPLAGATVLRGPMGFGARSHLHTAKVLRLSEDLPIVIEIVDKRAKIDAFLPVVDTMMGDGMVTLERVEVMHYRAEES